MRAFTGEPIVVIRELTKLYPQGETAVLIIIDGHHLVGCAREDPFLEHTAPRQQPVLDGHVDRAFAQVGFALPSADQGFHAFRFR
jgi:hypothetical protein